MHIQTYLNPDVLSLKDRGHAQVRLFMNIIDCTIINNVVIFFTLTTCRSRYSLQADTKEGGYFGKTASRSSSVQDVPE